MNWVKLIDNNFYGWNFLGLSVLGLLLRPYSMEVSFIEWPVSSLLSIYVLSSLLYTLRVEQWKWQKKLPAVFLFCSAHLFLAGIMEIVLTRFLRYEEFYTMDRFGEFLGDHATLILDAGLWCVFYMALFSKISTSKLVDSLQRNASELEKKLDDSDLNLLSQEINPHFLFNAMNGIAMKVRLNENKTAVTMIAALNDLLRINLKGQSNQLVTLTEELELLEKYLLIEKTRFGNQVHWSVNVPESIHDYKVPKLILQPLVENAFKHGMTNDSDQLLLQLEAAEEDQTLRIRVFNSKQDPAKINYASSNIGLPNVVHRLKQFFGSDFQFKSFIEPEGVAFQIIIPKVV